MKSLRFALAVVGTSGLLIAAPTVFSEPYSNANEILQEQPQPQMQDINPPESMQAISSLSAPELPLATDGNLDIGKATVNIPFKVAYPSFGPGHRVTLSWVGTTTYSTPIQTTATVLPLTFNVPKATAAADFGKTATVTYSVEVPGAPKQTSEPLEIKVMMDELSPPVTDLAEQGKIDIGKAPLSLPFNIAYPSLAAGQKVTLNWGGATPYKSAAYNTATTSPLTFTIPREIVAKDFGTAVPVTYTVEVLGVPVQTSIPVTLQVVFGNLPPPGLPAVSGVDTARNLNNRYNDIRDICEDDKPAYYCNGVVIRATQNGNYDPWNPSATAISLGGVSFSYMRKDAGVKTLYHNSGFTFLGQQDAIKQSKAMDFLCIYPYDAWTAQPRRPDGGCGLQPRAAQSADLSTCASVNAGTVDSWYAFTSTITEAKYQCSLSTQNPEQFAVSLKVRANRPANMPDSWNEILIKLWEQNIPKQLPIESFFYKNATGLAEARAYQQKYAARTGGQWLPIVFLDLGKLDTAPFSYNPLDQAVLP